MALDDKDVRELREWIKHHDKKLEDNTQRFAAITETLAEHRTRLQNGVEVFSDLRRSIEDLRPKKMPRWQVVFAIVGPIVTIGSLLWSLSKALDDRPTASQLKDIIAEHNAGEHPVTMQHFKEMHDEQERQRIMLERQSTVLDQVSHDVADVKLDIKAVTAAKAEARRR